MALRLGSLPMPAALPPEDVQLLITPVAGDEALKTGEQTAQVIRRVMRTYGPAPRDCRSMLDFGCGCGLLVVTTLRRSFVRHALLLKLRDPATLTAWERGASSCFEPPHEALAAYDRGEYVFAPQRERALRKHDDPRAIRQRAVAVRRARLVPRDAPAVHRVPELARLGGHASWLREQICPDS